MPNEPKTGVLPPSSYVNFLRVANNQSEFFLSFGQIAQTPQSNKTLSCGKLQDSVHCLSQDARVVNRCMGSRDEISRFLLFALSDANSFRGCLAVLGSGAFE